MFKKIASFTAVIFAFGLVSTVSHAELLGLYEFDRGGDGTSWDDAPNWEQVLDPDGVPISGDPATAPDAVTSVNISNGIGEFTPLIDNTMPGQTALDVNIGTASGAGLLTMRFGGLSIRDMFVGRDDVNSNAGSMNMSGGTLTAGGDITVGADSVGTMTMSNGVVSTGDDFNVNVDSSFTMTGGILDVGGQLVTNDNASLLVDGGVITADTDFFFFGSSQITVDSGAMIAFDALRFDDLLTTGKLTINGGLVRSQEFGFFDGVNYIMNGTVEINGNGLYQSELGVAAAKALIADNTFFTSEDLFKLDAFSVVVPDFDGRTNVIFTQVALVPEVPLPAAAWLFGSGLLGLVGIARRKKA